MFASGADKMCAGEGAMPARCGKNVGALRLNGKEPVGYTLNPVRARTLVIVTSGDERGASAPAGAQIARRRVRSPHLARPAGTRRSNIAILAAMWQET
jgi:hypothetical protein